METSEFTIPITDIYKLHILGSHGQINRIHIFSGKLKTESLKQSIFSENELREIDAHKTPLYYSELLIHKDDSISNIKYKLINEILRNSQINVKISYDELYLFAKISEQVHCINIYEEITQNNTVLFTKDMLSHYLLNINQYKNNTNQINETVSYEDLLDLNIENTTQIVNVSLGKQFSLSKDNLFLINPFDTYSDISIKYREQNKNNSIYSFENQLLFNYGKIINQNIYVCTAEDVLNNLNQYSIPDTFIFEYYFPLLYNKKVQSFDELTKQKPFLLKQTTNELDKNKLDYFNSIDLFYNIYYGRKNELNYIERGIQSFFITLTSEYNNSIPLEVIFKNIHSTKQIPFIKYNPGARKENLYRFYSEEMSKTGKKIPYLTLN